MSAPLRKRPNCCDAAQRRDVQLQTSTSGSALRHGVKFRDRTKVVNPFLLRANKNLPPWHQFISLPNRSEAHVVGFRLIVSRCRVNRRPTLRAESLQTDVSTIGSL